ncbi:tRNA-guanine transglycosylase DpdA [Hymenobacter sp. BT559]|uniref:tRNA-guanine transglycosylase DpdA n=1 Tax=Hymenobacter sp. BT559 TaxID=2795729 RepID=UPI0018EB2CD7|nr:tRNA-guanine transglycosylase DpdA [Hymenobacter sp. BT559]MBJ6146301.1 hypothetical protein [Hymenobacter sp. BT559]
MKILIVSSCTGEKDASGKYELSITDFEAGLEAVTALEARFPEHLKSAGQMYTGQQHLRLMDGVQKARAQSDLEVELHILSAGYGLISEMRSILPYEVTFATMGKKEIRSWSSYLQVPLSFRNTVSAPYDLGLILLGDNYLEACQLDSTISFGGPTLILCGSVIAKRLPTMEQSKIITLNNNEARQFRCGIIGLKGELAKRLLGKVVAEGVAFIEQFIASSTPLPLLTLPEDTKPAKLIIQKKLPVANPNVDQVIALDQNWEESPHKQKLRYFIPDWDDLVDPDFDFDQEVHAGGVSHWSNEVYAHQLYNSPNYDGILVSRAVVEHNKKRKALIDALGIHRSLRVPTHFPVMGDCGAFDYINLEKPPFSTADVLDYYTRYGFDLGVSVDHLIVGKNSAVAQERYDLTIHNAEEFLVEHQKLGLPWRPIGAVQGWDANSYAKAAKQYIQMGYDYIALGGLVRTSTKDMLKIVEEVSKVVPQGIDMHLFGIARVTASRTFAELGVTSVDSASHLRKAWMGANDNYWTLDGHKYAAIRIPEIGLGQHAKIKNLVARVGMTEARRLEQESLQGIRQYAKGQLSRQQALNMILPYDRALQDATNKALVDEGKAPKPFVDRSKAYEKTLLVKPWLTCPCELCQNEGVEIIIFRGNNRNRRRGFHNTYVFYSLLKRVLTDDQFFVDKGHELFESTARSMAPQMDLFDY